MSLQGKRGFVHLDPESKEDDQRWLRLSACMFAVSSCGVYFTFSTYSAALKYRWSLSQAQVETIAFGMYISTPFSWIPGMINDCAGPTFSFALGGTLGACGLCGQWLVATAHPVAEICTSSADVVVTCMSVLGAVAFQGSVFITGAAYSTIVRNFQRERGTATGLTKGWTGISGGILVQLFSAYLEPDSNTSIAMLSFLLLAASFVLATCYLAAFIFFLSGSHPSEKKPSNDEPGNGESEAAEEATSASTFSKVQDSCAMESEDRASKRRFAFALCILVTMVSVVTFSALAIPHSNKRGEQITGVIILLLLVAPLAIASPCWRGTLWRTDIGRMGLSDGANELAHVVGHERQQDLDTQVAPHSSSAESAIDVDIIEESSMEKKPASGSHDISLCQMLMVPDCWALLFCSSTLVGCGLMLHINAAQMYEAKGFSSEHTLRALVIFSVCQTCGRVMTGYMSDAVLKGFTRSNGSNIWLPRPAFLALASSCMALGHVLLLSPHLVALQVGAGLVGYAFGMSMPALVTIVSDLFGLTHLSANYMFYDGGCNFFGSLFWAKLLPQAVYHQSLSHSSGQVSETCLGSSCFALTHVIIACVQMLAVILALLLCKRSLGLYRQSRVRPRIVCATG